MLERLRPFLKKILDPIAKQTSINPNIITISSPLLAVVSAVFFGTGNLLGGALFILISGLFDVLDGAIARYHNKASKFGAFLDSTMDRFSDAIIIIGLIFGGYTTWFIGILAIHSAYTVSYVRASAESKGIDCNIGIAERATRLIILMIGAVVAVILDNTLYMTGAILLMILLSYITVVQRMYHVWKLTKSKE